MTTLPNTTASFCGWGPWGSTAFIPFSVVRDDTSGTLPDWQLAPNLAVQPVPGSNRVIVQNMGMAPATITLRLWFDQADDFARLIGAIGTSSTLTVVRGTQSLAGADVYRQGWAYTQLDQVYCAAISDVTRYVDGQVECSAQFLRAVNPLTRLAVS